MEIRGNTSELEDRPTETIQSEQHKKKKYWKRNEESPRKMWENTKKPNICGIGVPLEKRKHSEEII